MQIQAQFKPKRDTSKDNQKASTSTSSRPTASSNPTITKVETTLKSKRTTETSKRTTETSKRTTETSKRTTETSKRTTETSKRRNTIKTSTQKTDTVVYRLNPSDIPAKKVFNVSKREVNFAQKGGTDTLTVFGSDAWECSITPDPTWGKISTEGDKLLLTVEPNNRTIPRTDYLEIADGRNRIRININQQGIVRESQNTTLSLEEEAVATKKAEETEKAEKKRLLDIALAEKKKAEEQAILDRKKAQDMAAAERKKAEEAAKAEQKRKAELAAAEKKKAQEIALAEKRKAEEQEKVRKEEAKLLVKTIKQSKQVTSQKSTKYARSKSDEKTLKWMKDHIQIGINVATLDYQISGEMDNYAYHVGPRLRFGKANHTINVIGGIDYGMQWGKIDGSNAQIANQLILTGELRSNIIRAKELSVFVGAAGDLSINSAKKGASIHDESLAITPKFGISTKHVDFGAELRIYVKNHGIPLKKPTDTRIGAFISWYF